MKKNTLFAIISVVATFIATTAATSACVWWLYQPKEPTSLQDK